VLNLDLLTKSWIPTSRGLLSLEDTWKLRYGLNLAAPFYLKLSFFRLLFACQVAGEVVLPETQFQWDFEPAEDTGSSALDHLNLRDGNSIKFDPDSLPRSTEVNAAQALVQMYFSDRGGLKSRVPGFPTSGSVPPHVGKTSVYKYAETLGDFLDRNSDPDWGEDYIDYFLHPWRRIKVISPERIVVCAGEAYKGEIEDPWAIDSGRMEHIRNGIPEKLLKKLKLASGKYYYTTMVLKQATILAVWDDVFSIV
jgi:hypothetical protein